MMRRLFVIAPIGMILLILMGCKSTSNRGADLPSGRYAVQWKGYIGASRGEAIYPQFAFIDVYAQEGKHSQPQFNEIELITDHGPVSAEAASISPSPPGQKYQFFTVMTRVEGLHSGIYKLRELRYVDEARQVRRLAVGDWTIEVLTRNWDDLEESETTIGATSFGMIDATLNNKLPSAVTIEGLKFALPSMVVRTKMSSEPVGNKSHETTQQDSGQPADEDRSNEGPPSTPAASKPVAQIVLKPNQPQTVTFDFSTKDLSQREQFVALKPFVRYRVADGSAPRYYPLPHQVYSSPFDNDEQIGRYLRGLPVAAHHTL